MHRKLPKKMPPTRKSSMPMSDEAAGAKLPAFLKKKKKGGAVQSSGTGPGFSAMPMSGGY